MESLCYSLMWLLHCCNEMLHNFFYSLLNLIEIWINCVVMYQLVNENWYWVKFVKKLSYPWFNAKKDITPVLEFHLFCIKPPILSVWQPASWSRNNEMTPLYRHSLVSERPGCHFKTATFNLVLLIGIFTSSKDNALRWMPMDLTDDKSTLVQVMAWCRQATSHYLSQCWPSSMLSYGVTRSQWVNLTAIEVNVWMNNDGPMYYVNVIT